jgi:hypothetical protein
VEREEPTSADMNACQDAMEANPEKMELNPGEKGGRSGAAGDS